MVLIANPAKIPDRTPGDFGCREDFDRKEFCFPSQIPATLPPRYPVARQESRKDSRRDPAEILAAGNPVSRQESRQDSRRDPAEILAAGNPAFPPRIPVRIPAGTGNPGGQNLGGIPAGILAGSWQDPAKIPVPFLQGLSQNAKLRHSRTSVTICPLKFGGCAKIVSRHKNFRCVEFKCCLELSFTFSHLWIK